MARYRKTGNTDNVFSLSGKEERLEILREGLLAMSVSFGVSVLVELMNEEAASIAGPKGKRNPDRKANHWASSPTSVVLGGRKIQVSKHRVRTKDGQEVTLKTFLVASDDDLLQKTVMEGILCGLGTRSYDRALEPIGNSLNKSGTSRSSMSRRVVAGTRAELEKLMSRDLSDLNLIALVADGIHLADHVVIVALGIDTKETKHVLGLREGSTENAAVATSLMNDLIERGLDLSSEIGIVKKQFQVQTTQSNHPYPIARNLLRDIQKPSRPNEIWVSDITYIKTKSGWVYLAGVLDMFSRKIVGWKVSKKIDTELVMKAMVKALRSRPAPKIHHSDRGAQYASHEYQKMLSLSLSHFCSEK